MVKKTRSRRSAAAMAFFIGGVAPPPFLRDTRLYSDFTSRTIDPRNMSYSPQCPLWSDGAAKRRWIFLPAGASIDTADPETGLGKWTAGTFIDSIRSGRLMGKGRQILPPMPYQALRNLTDDDLRAIFVYLQPIPKLKNRVPDPIAPGSAAGN